MSNSARPSQAAAPWNDRSAAEFGRRLGAEFGRDSEVARPTIARLVERLASQADDSQSPHLFHAWQRHLVDATGLDFERLGPALAPLSEPGSRRSAAVSLLLFSAQTYFALVVKLLLWRAFGDGPSSAGVYSESPASMKATLQKIESGEAFLKAGLPVPFTDDTFSWYLDGWDATLAECLLAIDGRLSTLAVADLRDATHAGHDILAALYQALFPPAARHALGEFYTPAWLADHVLDAAGYDASPGARLLDPACGSGTFLIRAIHRLRYRAAEADPGADDASLCRHIVQNVVGFDLNPIAVLTARAGYLLALGPLASYAEGTRIPVFLRDAILEERKAEPVAPEEPAANDASFDLVVGNPPWIAWDHLPPSYREATKPLWKRYGLFTLSGTEARHGGGKKDLAMLMILCAADRHLRDGGRLAMVLTQTVFQTRGAGDGFRRLRLGTNKDATPLAVLRVDDMTAIRPFPDASNWTATIVVEKGRATTYPVPYVRWKTSATGKKSGPNAFAQHDCLAEPIDDARPGSPWLVRPVGLRAPLSKMAAPSAYTAHLGANTGGANGVYWVQVVEAVGRDVRVRNLAGRGKRAVPEVEAVVEPDLLFPLLRWRDIAPFRAVPSAYLILAQDPATRTGIEIQRMEHDHPRTLAYLVQFEETLRRRAAYRRYQGTGPFYAMYNVGPYTTAEHKVVWRRMDHRIRAAAVGPVDDPVLGRTTPIGQETCVQIAAASSDEAHYLAAVFNSAVVNLLAVSHNVRGGKGFGSPGMLEYLAVEKFRPRDARHQQLAVASQKAHRAAAAGEDLTAIEQEIDVLVGRLRGLSRPEIAAVRGEVERT